MCMCVSVCVRVCVWKAPLEVCIDHWITWGHWGGSVMLQPTSRKEATTHILYNTCTQTHTHTHQCCTSHTWIHLSHPCNTAYTHKMTINNATFVCSKPPTHKHTQHSRLVCLLLAQRGTGHQLSPPQMPLNLRVESLSSLLINWLICDAEAWALRCYFCSLQLTLQPLHPLSPIQLLRTETTREVNLNPIVPIGEGKIKVERLLVANIFGGWLGRAVGCSLWEQGKMCLHFRVMQRLFLVSPVDKHLM